jgi:acetyltransferase-like isoleucine patch superfamily enzyme
LFAGRGLILEHAWLIHLGRNVIIEDRVTIRALSSNGIRVGDRVTIGAGSIIVGTGVIQKRGVGLSIGDNSAIGPQSFLGAQGGIVIGSNVIMGPGVRFFSENHNFDSKEQPIRLQGTARKGIEVGENCWIGAGAIILDGVHIGSGCVIAAGCVVSKDVPPNSIWAGIPGKLVSMRVPE